MSVSTAPGGSRGRPRHPTCAGHQHRPPSWRGRPQGTAEL